jgi:hypothetical protein
MAVAMFWIAFTRALTSLTTMDRSDVLMTNRSAEAGCSEVLGFTMSLDAGRASGMAGASPSASLPTRGAAVPIGIVMGA